MNYVDKQSSRNSDSGAEMVGGVKIEVENIY